MATNHTENIGLSQWLADDEFKRSDFNADNLAIDTAFASALKVVTGTYTGTGIYGQNNKSSLTFDFTPKLIFITQKTQTNGQAVWILWNTAAPLLMNAGGSSTYQIDRLYATYSDNTVSWYHNSTPEQQLNYSGWVYNYMAVG